METVHEKPVAACAPGSRRAIAGDRERHRRAGPREMMSGAGHDGQAMVHLTDIGMIFVRCRAGISHNPLEFVTVADSAAPSRRLIRTIVAMGEESEALSRGHACLCRQQRIRPVGLHEPTVIVGSRGPCHRHSFSRRGEVAQTAFVRAENAPM